jgi:hypothetical protein
MDGYIPPSEWGPSGWDFFYATAGGYDPSRKEYYRTFFKSIPFILRCDECNHNFAALVTRRPVDDYLTTPEKLLEWVYLSHMDVRKHQRVKSAPDFTLQDVYDRYLPPDEHPEETAPAIDEHHPISIATTGGRREQFSAKPSTSQQSVPITVFALADKWGRPATVATPVPSPQPTTSAPGSAVSISMFSVAGKSVYDRAHSNSGTPALSGYQRPPASAVGLQRCCKGRVQMAAAGTGTNVNFVV